MKILCPFVELEWPVEFMLRAEHEGSVVWEDCRGDDEAYFNAVARLWNESETFVVCEQDMLPYPGAVQEIYDCPRPFCSTPAPHFMDTFVPGWRWNLSKGLVKYGKALIEREHDHFEHYEGNRHWSQFDWELMWTYEEEIHYHLPPIIHLSPTRFVGIELVYSKR